MMEKRMTPFLSALLCAALLLGLLLPFGTLTALGVEPMDYHREGLIAWYDGVNNANGEHDPGVDYWRDLTGNVGHLDLRAMISKNAFHWEDNAISIHPETGIYQRFPERSVTKYSVMDTLAGDAYTLELALKDVEYGAEAQTLTLLSTYNGDMELCFDVSDPESIRLFYRNSITDTHYPVAEGAEAYLHESTITVTYDESLFDGTADGQGVPNVVLYVNGQAVATGESSERMCPDYGYLGHVNESRRWGGGVYGLRVYDRALTAEEVAENAAADDFNYRQGNEIIPEEQYDPSLDYLYGGSGLNESYIYGLLGGLLSEMPHFPVDVSTNMIPRGGEYAAVNLVERIYGNHNEARPPDWYGARIKRADSDTDEGSPDAPETAEVSFTLKVRGLYDLVGLEPLPGLQARCVLLRATDTEEIESITVRVVGYDTDTNTEIVSQKEVRPEAYAYYHEGEEYFLMYTGVELDDAEWIERVEVTVPDMGKNDEFYLRELCFFADPIEMEKYGVSTQCILPVEDPNILQGDYTNDRLIFNATTDLIPLLGFYGSVNLLDYLYPNETDEEKWEGARIMRTEENETDYDGTELTKTSFRIMYDQYCRNGNFTPLTGKEARYVAVSMVVNGDFDGMTLRVAAYDEDTYEDMDFIAELCGSIDFEKPGEVQTLVLDTGGILDDSERLTRLYVEIEGMDPTTVIYLREIAFFENEADAYEYAGYKPADSDTETAPDTDNIGCETTASIETDGGTESDTRAIAVCPPERFGGCKSVVGFGAAVLTSAAALVVLKRSRRE